MNDMQCSSTHCVDKKRFIHKLLDLSLDGISYSAKNESQQFFVAINCNFDKSNCLLYSGLLLQTRQTFLRLFFLSFPASLAHKASKFVTITNSSTSSAVTVSTNSSSSYDAQSGICWLFLHFSTQLLFL